MGEVTTNTAMLGTGGQAEWTAAGARIGASVRVAQREEADAVAALVNRAYAVETFFVDGHRTTADEVEELTTRGEVLEISNPVKLPETQLIDVIEEPRILATIITKDEYLGGILALCSMPAFDPNSFIGGIGRVEWKMLNDDDHIPLLNKALRGLYPPGSTMKH